MSIYRIIVIGYGIIAICCEALAIFLRGEARVLFEDPRESENVLVSYRKRDVGDRDITVYEELFCAIEPFLHQIFARRDPVLCEKQISEISAAYKEAICDLVYSYGKMQIIAYIAFGFGYIMVAFLFSLGCYGGEPITVISRKKSSCVVSIKDGRYNIDKQLAKAIIVKE